MVHMKQLPVCLSRPQAPRRHPQMMLPGNKGGANERTLPGRLPGRGFEDSSHLTLGLGPQVGSSRHQQEPPAPSRPAPTQPVASRLGPVVVCPGPDPVLELPRTQLLPPWVVVIELAVVCA